MYWCFLINLVLNKVENDDDDDNDDDDEIKQLFIYWGSYLENKEELIIAGVQILFNDPNMKVKTQNTVH